MPKEIDVSFFDVVPEYPSKSNKGFDLEVPGVDAHSGISVETSRYLEERSEMFQKVTQGKNKPMVYGGMKKDIRK